MPQPNLENAVCALASLPTTLLPLGAWSPFSKTQSIGSNPVNHSETHCPSLFECHHFLRNDHTQKVYLIFPARSPPEQTVISPVRSLTTMNWIDLFWVKRPYHCHLCKSRTQPNASHAVGTQSMFSDSISPFSVAITKY
jgi:hypothetical protein